MRGLHRELAHHARDDPGCAELQVNPRATCPVLTVPVCRCQIPECGESAPFHTSSNMPSLRCGCGQAINLFKVSSIYNIYKYLHYLHILVCRG